MFGKSNFNTYDGFDRWFQGVQCGYGGSYQDNESPGFNYHANKNEYATDLLAAKTIECTATSTSFWDHFWCISQLHPTLHTRRALSSTASPCRIADWCLGSDVVTDSGLQGPGDRTCRVLRAAAGLGSRTLHRTAPTPPRGRPASTTPPA